jgi:hypothetical protein
LPKSYLNKAVAYDIMLLLALIISDRWFPALNQIKLFLGVETMPRQIQVSLNPELMLINYSFWGPGLLGKGFLPGAPFNPFL